MVFDRNPRFGADQNYETGARRVADLLWETTQGDITSAPKSYLENFRHEYSDGKVSMLELIDRIDLGSDATYEEYCEAVEKLLSVDSERWPNPDSVHEVQLSKLDYEIEPDLDFSEFDDLFDFADQPSGEAPTQAPPPQGGEAPAPQGGQDPLSSKMELFFKKVISSVYLDGVSSVTDVEGNPPNEANNYLLSEDGKSFAGKFVDDNLGKPKEFPFTITEKPDGTWAIKY
jgi:hypothetical protein